MSGTPPTRWRAARSTLVAATGAAVLAVGVLILLSVLAWRDQSSLVVAVVCSLLALAVVGYVWRFALHPSLHWTGDDLVVRNPLRTSTLPLDDLSVVVPGENGLVLATDEATVEAWCIQKSTRSIRHGRSDTRADQIAGELTARLDARDRDHPSALDRHRPAADGFVVRRAAAAEATLLADLERRASEAALAHVFGDRPYPFEDVRRRWLEVLRDPALHVRIATLDQEPVGYLAYSAVRVHHLGVRPDHFRSGFGRRLLDYATGEIFDRLTPQATLWVLSDNTVARTFYTSCGWRPSGRTGHSEFPPHPEEVELVLDNPVTPRRGGR